MVIERLFVDESGRRHQILRAEWTHLAEMSRRRLLRERVVRWKRRPSFAVSKYWRKG